MGGVIPLLPLSEYDFSNVADGLSVVLPIAEVVDVAPYGSCVVRLRLHAGSIPADASVRLELREVAPTAEDPARFFRGATLATVTLTSSSAVPALVESFTALPCGQVGVYLTATQKTPAGTIAVTISADLVVKDGLPTWTPASLGSKVKLWLDRRDLVEVFGAYSDWGDQSRAGTNDFTQSSSSLRPSAGAAINGQPAPNFDGGDDELEGPKIQDFVGFDAYHVFVVLRADSVSGTDADPLLNNGVIGDTDLGWWGLYLRDNSGSYEAQGFHWDSAARVATGTGLQLATDTLIEWSYDATTVRCRVGNGAVGTDTGNGAIGDRQNFARIGTGATGSLFFDGRIACIIACDVCLPAAEVRLIRAYLRSVYNVVV